MKKFAVVVLVLLILGVMAGSVMAWNGVTGQVRDSVYQQGWVHGGDVWILNGAYETVATGSLDANGTFAVPYTACLFGAPCDGVPGGTMTVYIDFNCQISGNTCTPPVGYPATAQVSYPEAGPPINLNLGYIYTGTGPNAVNLQNFSAESGSILPMVLGSLLLVLVTGTAVFFRKRHTD